MAIINTFCFVKDSNRIFLNVAIMEDEHSNFSLIYGYFYQSVGH